MTPAIRCQPGHGFDFRPRAPALPRLGEATRLPLAWKDTAARLYPFGEAAVVESNDGVAWVRIAERRIDPLPFPFRRLCPSADTTGRALTWDGDVVPFDGAAVGPVQYRTDVPATHVAAYGLPDGSTLISLYEPHGPRLLRVTGQQITWQIDRRGRQVHPVDELVCLTQPGRVEAIGIEDGRVRWDVPTEGTSIVGSVDDTLWLVGPQSGDPTAGVDLVGLSLTDGSPAGRVPMGVVRPGPIDPEGRMHLLTGGSWRTIDLRTGTIVRQVERKYRVGVEGRYRVEGGLVFTDGTKGGLWHISDDEPDQERLLHRAPAWITSVVVTPGGVVIYRPDGHLELLPAAS